MHDQLGPRAKRLVGGGVHVAEHDVGLQADFEDRVGAAVHADEHRTHVAYVGPKRAQVLAIGGPPYDDQRVTLAEAGAHRGQLDLPNQELPLLAEPGHGVLGECRERVVDALSLRLEPLSELVGGQLAPCGEHGPVAADLPAGDHHHLTVPKLLEQRRGWSVDQSDSGLRQHERLRVRIAAGGERRHVDYGSDP